MEHHDEAGRLRLTAFDFKGNVLEKSWQVVADEVFTGQWASAASQNWASLPTDFNRHWDDLSTAAVAARLAPRAYVTTSAFDALNRATQLTLPAESGRQQARPVLQPVYNRAGALAQVRLDGELLIRQLAYNARGQRLLLARGNGLLTRYAYDPVTLRLQRLRTESYQENDLTFNILSGSIHQDTTYIYDLSGSITSSTEHTTSSGVAGADELTRLFTYDALNRLVEATGRENQPTAPTPWQESTRATGTGNTTAYRQKYSYDKIGNILSLTHQSINSNTSFTRRFNYASNSNHLRQVQVGASNTLYEHDMAGNITRENESRHLQWNVSDQLKQYANWTGPNRNPTVLSYYLYTSDGKRAKKIVQTSAITWQVTVYTTNGFEHRYTIANNTVTEEQTQIFIIDRQSRLFQRRSGDSLGDQRPPKLYLLEDHLGSATIQTDGTGQRVSHAEYYPFGEISLGSVNSRC